MSRGYLLALCYTLAAMAWAVLSLYTTFTEFNNSTAIDAIKSNRAVSAHDLSAMKSEYHTALMVLPCNSSLQRDYHVILGHESDNSASRGDSAAYSAALESLRGQLKSTLACQPLDGKLWLDYAMISLELSGFDDDVRKSYLLSQAMSPRESWLAEKRTYLAINLAPILNDALKQRALNDLMVLDAANHYRLNGIYKKTPYTTLPQLQALFTASAGK